MSIHFRGRMNGRKYEALTLTISEGRVRGDKEAEQKTNGGGGGSYAKQ
jgi:hypothetical protein